MKPLLQEMGKCADCPVANRGSPLAAALQGHEATRPFSELQRYSRGQLIVEQEAPVRGWWIIRRGHAEVFLTDPQGNQHTIRVSGPGNLLGTCALKGAGTYCYSARALDPVVEVCCIPMSAIPYVLVNCPQLSETLLAQMASDLATSYRKLHRMATMTARERLAHMLLELMNHPGNRPGRLRTTIPLRRKQLGDMIGVSTETAVRTLTDLREEGIVATRGRYITILDAGRLQAIADAQRQ